MSRKYNKKLYYKGAAYHIYNRGVNGETIFLNELDYRVYWKYLAEALKKFDATIFNYVFMPNHIHFSARQNSDVPISKFMHWLHLKFAQYFNKHHGRFGHLFQSRFKAIIIEEEYYLLRLSKYIHLNPVIAGLVAKPAKWPFTSYPFYIGEREYDLCDKDFIIKTYCHGSAETYKEYVEGDMSEIVKLKKETKFQKLLLE